MSNTSPNEQKVDSNSSSTSTSSVIVGCWCTSFEQNLYRPQVCLGIKVESCL